MKYTFEALNLRREKQSGTIDASSRDEAIEKLKVQRLFPTALHQAPEQPPQPADEPPGDRHARP